MLRPRALASFLALLLLASVASADEPKEDAPPPDVTSEGEAPAPSSEAIAKAQKTLVELGDKARARGQVTEALKLYRQALELHDDPELRARMGLFLMEIDQPVAAGSLLLDALEAGAGKDAKEKETLVRGILAVRSRICLLHVRADVPDARVTLNGESGSEEMGGNFRAFERPGRVVIVGQSKEQGEVREVVDCPAGGQAFVHLRWKQPEVAPKTAPAAAPTPASTPAAPPAPCVSPKATSTPASPLAVRNTKADSPLGVYIERALPKQEDPFAYDDPPTKPARKAPTSGFVGVGPVVVFGAATWVPAVGASITGGLQLHEHVSVELEGRAAWLAGTVKGESISTTTAGGMLGLCGRWRWLFGCGLGHLGVITVNWDEESFAEDKTNVFIRPGFGGRVGARLDLGTSWGVQVAADVLGLSRGTRIALGQTVLVEQPAIMIGTSLGGFWTF